MEGISGITARIASLQSQVAALSPGGTATATASRLSSGSASSTGTSSSTGSATSGSTASGSGAPGSGTSAAAFSDVLAQQLAGAAGAAATASPLQALLGTGTGTDAGTSTAAGAAGAALLTEPAYTTTTTTSLSGDGLAQLLASLTGAAASTAPAGTAPASTARAQGVATTAAVRTGAPSASAPATTAVTTSGKVDAKGVPLELKVYGNGKVPVDRLVEIGGAGSGERLWAPAAAAFEKMSAAARADGVRFGVNDSYRSYEDQVAMAARKGLRSEGGLAAAPGTSSHGWGMAVDLQLDGRGQAWVREHAGAYGFAETVAGEPWHWGFRSGSV